MEQEKPNEYEDMMKSDDFETIYNEMKNTNHIKDILEGIA